MGAISLGSGAVYVEGYVIDKDGLPIAFEHGWIEHDGEVIDPTPVYCDGEFTRSYFAGVRYTYHEVLGRVSRNQLMPFVGMNGVGDNPGHRLAYMRACKIMYGDQFEEVAVMLRMDKFPEFQQLQEI